MTEGFISIYLYPNMCRAASHTSRTLDCVHALTSLRSYPEPDDSYLSYTISLAFSSVIYFVRYRGRMLSDPV